jgi:sulfatase modifying factor 1
MKRLKALICGMAFTLPALFMIYCGSPTEFEKGKDAQLKAADSLNIPVETTNSIGMKLRLIPAGSFMMGAVPGDDEAEVDEKPRHSVEISKAFYIGVYEVTQAEWEAVMGTTVRQQRDKANPDWPIAGEGPRYPVYYVSWNDAVEFCRKLSEKEGVTYWLPTEAEWEYAARGGEEGNLYVWGDEKRPLVNGIKQANVADESIKGGKLYEALKPLYNRYGYFAGYDDGYAESSPAGSFAPNGFGLYDMAGNVWEWCADWCDDGYYGGSPPKDPAGPPSGESRVLRGGSWVSRPMLLRTSDRYWVTTVYWVHYFGFRVVRDVE